MSARYGVLRTLVYLKGEGECDGVALSIQRGNVGGPRRIDSKQTVQTFHKAVQTSKDGIYIRKWDPKIEYDLADEIKKVVVMT
ncbi:hypothetical protein COLO4_29840 [Corchorus olitorius]|uniref:Uncharacterized protein n=1 Tax=Corchorus olitorius TaxID=93759 RepID=A0A1R3HCY3_9ROSI|nr:hypothetical protein COLO4_29840 [Corchorus olitorius]